MSLLERKIEAEHRKRAKENGDRLWKWTSPGTPGVPDDILTRAIKNPYHRGIVGRYLRFQEFKKPGEKPDPLQVLRIKELTDLGYAVDVINRLPV